MGPDSIKHAIWSPPAVILQVTCQKRLALSLPSDGWKSLKSVKLCQTKVSTNEGSSAPIVKWFGLFCQKIHRAVCLKVKFFCSNESIHLGCQAFCADTLNDVLHIRASYKLGDCEVFDLSKARIRSGCSSHLMLTAMLAYALCGIVTAVLVLSLY